MKAIIIDQGEKYYTHLKKYFEEIDGFQRNYNWLITSYECHPQDEEIRDRFLKEVVWLSGDELTDIVYKEDFQWIWGVLSGFSKDISKEEAISSKIPVCEGNTNIWEEEIELQHPLANIEIIAWDSTLTVIKSKDDEIINLFCEKYKYVKDWKTTLQSW